MIFWSEIEENSEKNIRNVHNQQNQSHAYTHKKKKEAYTRKRKARNKQTQECEKPEINKHKNRKAKAENNTHLRKNNKLQFLLVDVREEYEYNVSRINGVDFLMPLSELYDKVKEIENQKELPIVMQCKLGGRSQQAQRQLEIMGFKNVINLAGGITEYTGDIIYGN